MVSPSQRRRAAVMIQDRLGFSQRRACQIVGQHRSTQRHRPAEPDPDRDLRRQLRDFARHHPRWGYRRAHAVLCREGHHLNRKKVQRLWREEGLRVPPRRHKRPRLGVSTTPADRLSATHPNHVWALDYQFDVTSQGRKLKILHVTDEFTRESLSDLVAYSIDADHTVAALDQIVAERGAPEFIRCDNGPELTANALLTGATSPAPVPATSIPAAHGRTPGSSPMALGCERSCFPSSSSTPSWRPESLSQTGRRSTTPIVRIRRLACSLQPSSPLDGGTEDRFSSRSGWADQRGPVTCPMSFAPNVPADAPAIGRSGAPQQSRQR